MKSIMHVKINSELKKFIKSYAAKTGDSMASIVEIALAEFKGRNQ